MSIADKLQVLAENEQRISNEVGDQADLIAQISSVIDEKLAGGGEEPVNKLAGVVDGSITELTAEDLEGATNIRYYAFYYSGLTSVALPDSVTEVGNYAFRNSQSLTNVVIPESVTKIGDYAFAYCKSLTSIVIPNSVTFLSDYAFQDCSSLTNAVIGNGVPHLRSYVFHNCSKLASVTIPNSVTRIDNGTFQSCISLTSVVIPDSVTTIGQQTFRESGLTNIEIPDNVTSIGRYAVAYCNNLTSAVIGAGVTKIDMGVFYGSTKLKRVDLSKHTQVPTLGTSVFNSTDLQIKVPANLIDSWKTATNWSDYADKIVTEFTNEV